MAGPCRTDSRRPETSNSACHDPRLSLRGAQRSLGLTRGGDSPPGPQHCGSPGGGLLPRVKPGDRCAPRNDRYNGERFHSGWKRFGAGPSFDCKTDATTWKRPSLAVRVPGGRSLSDATARRGRSTVAVVVVSPLVIAVVVALLAAAGFAVPLFTTALAAVVAAFPAAAVTPDRRGQELQNLDRRGRVVAGDDQFTGPRVLFRGFVANHDSKARTRMQRGRERVVDQLPVAVLAFERDARDVQLAVAHVADRDDPLLTAACPHATEEG